MKKTAFTTEEFLNKLPKNIKNKYNFDKAEYKNNKTKICVICSIHGEFWIRADRLLNGKGCPKCSKIYAQKLIKLTTSEFIEKAQEIHKNEDGTTKYDYSKVEYKNNKTKVCIICKEHGEFWQKPNDHLGGHGCCECGRKRNVISKEEFIKKAQEIHKNEDGTPKYDYSLVEFLSTNDKIKIICPIHGEFKQSVYKHLKGCGCKTCANIKNGNLLLLSQEEYIKRANKIHNDFYNYSKLKYTGYTNKIKIICPIHGEFEVRADSHLNGAGCPYCHKESKLEKELRILFEANNIRFEEWKRFDWLNRQSLDFYLPDYNIAIECQGLQHFKPVEWFGGEEELKKRIKLDDKKYNLCIENNINIIYFTHFKGIKNNKYIIFYTTQELLNYIYNKNNN